MDAPIPDRALGGSTAKSRPDHVDPYRGDRIAALEQQLAATRAERDRLGREGGDLRAANARLSGEVAAFRSSTSWRVTAPLRAVSRAVKPGLRQVRRATRIIWWTVTLQLPRRLRARRAALLPASVPPTVYSEIRRFTAPGSAFEPFDPTPTSSPRARVFAFHLPQFHAVPENDLWWGEGFTEWRNVTRGVPRFVDHHQPRVPRDLGFYDLTHPDTLRKQAAMARAAGIEGFCFYYYRFAQGRVLQSPTESLLADPTLDLPFCLLWANENWTRAWDGHDQDVLIPQTYDPALEDALIPDLARHFADPRYLRVDGRPVFIVYRPGLIPDPAGTLARWRARFHAEHGEQPYLLMAQGFGDEDPRLYGLDGAIEFPPHKLAAQLPEARSTLTPLDPGYSGSVRSYVGLVAAARAVDEPPFDLIRTVAPSWDNEARRPGRGTTYHGSTPVNYRTWLDDAIRYSRRHPFQGQPLVFVNAWNEWAEAAYLEPDVHLGAAYLNATSRAIAGRTEPGAGYRVLLVGHDAHRHGAQLLLLELGRTLTRRFGIQVHYLLLAAGDLLPEYEKVTSTEVVAAEALRSRLLQLRAAGYDRAITNTVVTGPVAALMASAGFSVTTLVHEMPDYIEERGWQDHAVAAAANAEHLVFPAQLIADRFRERFATRDEAVRILPQGTYRVADLAAVPEARQRVRNAHGWDDNTIVVLGVGFGDRRKGLDRFLATAGVAEQTNARLRFVWLGNVERGWTDWVAETTPVPHLAHHIPFTDDVMSWYAAADVLFVSSREDAYPSTVLEAATTGLPVAAFEGSIGNHELVRRNGEMLDVSDPEAIVAALSRIGAMTSESRLARALDMRAHLEHTHRLDEYAFALLRLHDPDLAKVSVVIPNYQYARHLPERLTTVFDQGYPVFEVILLDDGSSDDSIAVARQVAEQAGRDLEIEVREGNSGSAITQWRTGVERSRGSVVWIAEADDSSEPDFLGWMVNRLSREGTVMAFSDSATIDIEGQVTAPSYQGYYRSVRNGQRLSGDFTVAGSWFATHLLAVENVVLNVSSVVFDRDALDQVLSDQRFALDRYGFAGDWHVYLHLAKKGAVGYVARPLNRHRRHPDGMTLSADARRHVEDIARAQAEAARLFGLPPDARSRQEDYRRRVWTRLTD